MNRTHNPSLRPFSQKLRREMTKEERHLWYDFLRQLPASFNRQKVIGPYIVDFYCAKAALVVELDGSQHYEADGIASDQVRDAYLSGLGLCILRYSNAQINRDFCSVCEDIMKHLSNTSDSEKRNATMTVRTYTSSDLPAMIAIWNEVVEDGVAFPQEEPLDAETGEAFFAGQSHCGVAEDEDGRVAGLYILHPNNLGRCGHICNASYAVRGEARGRHIGEALVKDCLEQAKRLGFRVLQFNAVVECNTHARHLYERLGFVRLGTIPGGFRMKDGHYENICLYYRTLE